MTLDQIQQEKITQGETTKAQLEASVKISLKDSAICAMNHLKDFGECMQKTNILRSLKMAFSFF